MARAISFEDFLYICGWQLLPSADNNPSLIVYEQHHCSHSVGAEASCNIVEVLEGIGDMHDVDVYMYLTAGSTVRPRLHASDTQAHCTRTASLSRYDVRAPGAAWSWSASVVVSTRRVPAGTCCRRPPSHSKHCTHCSVRLRHRDVITASWSTANTPFGALRTFSVHCCS